MKFSKQTHEMVADILRVQRYRARTDDRGTDQAIRAIAREFSDWFAVNNLRFDAERFEGACQPAPSCGRFKPVRSSTSEQEQRLQRPRR